MPPHFVFGAGGIGTTAKSFTYTFDTAEKTSELLDALKNLNILELDSGQSYPPGNPWCANTLLGESRAAEKGFLIHDKIEAHRPPPILTEELIEANLNRSLAILGVKSVPVIYAHYPDPVTPIEVTAAAFDKQHRAGKFVELGLCSYNVQDLTKYFEICDTKGYVKPSIYQGMYNPLYRKIEGDLLSLLRKHSCKFYAYSPLAGGFLTGKVTFGSEEELHRTRWRGDSIHRAYGPVFDRHPIMHDAIRKLKSVCDAQSQPISLHEATLRWLVNHSVLQDGDGIIIGAKRIDVLEKNIADSKNGPLSPELRDAVEGLWDMVKIVFDEES